jgi:hypothetical protein
MAGYTLTQRQIPLDDSWDVIVVGGGPAGCTAATAAAREGARTLLIESTGCLGGMATAGLVPMWAPVGDQERNIYLGLAEKVRSTCSAGMPHIDPRNLGFTPLDPERLKRIYDDLVLGAGAKVLFHTQLCAVDTDGKGTVATIVLSNKAGLSACRAKVYVDCTGDADLAAWAGAAFEKGDDAGDMQPGTLCFVLTNVDDYGYLNGPRRSLRDPNNPIYKILASGKYPQIPDTHMCNNPIGPRTVGFNAGHLWKVDNTDPVSISKAIVQGRKIAAAYRDGLAEFQPDAYGGAFLVSTASLVGIRETRRVVGDYMLTFEDYQTRRSFDDEIGRNSYYIDIHVASAKDAQRIEDLKKFDGTCFYYGKGESHGVPYRCLTPKTLRNVLVAGRSISCDRAVQGTIRVMPLCMVMGEAAGMAAAHATSLPGCNVHAVDTKRLRARLKEEGGYLPEPSEMRPAEPGPGDPMVYNA